jgi:hypothetical protein
MVRFFDSGIWTCGVGTVPELPGVYALSYDGKGVVYIGMTIDLLRRYRQWSTAIHHVRLRKVNSALMCAAIRDWPKAGWAFSVVVSGAELTRDDLSKLERRAIRRALSKDVDLLNVILPDAPKASERVYRPSYAQLKRERLGQSYPKVTDSEP